MKKNRWIVTLIFFVLSGLSFSAFAQTGTSGGAASAANRKTAQRCLSLSENFMLNGDWQNALSQAELGLSYDSGISDLLYVKAAALTNLGYKRSI